MTRSRWIGVLILLLCSGISIFSGTSLARTAPGGIIDFKGVYYGTRCLLQHCDPYNESELTSFFLGEDREHPSGPIKYLEVVTLYVNLPTTFLFVAPFALLPWEIAHLLWMTATGGTFIIAALMIWRLGVDYEPRISTALVALVLANTEVLFVGGNAAGIVVGACIIAVWCFIQERLATLGVLCLAVSLTIKPHDAGLVWLYFLLAGGLYRKRALQTLAVTVALSLAAVAWVSYATPHWFPELHSNLSRISAHGGLNDQSPDSITASTAGMVVDLQGALSIFRDNPHFYNPVTYVVCAALFFVWLLMVLRTKASQAGTWLALSAVVPLTMLVTYHRPNDAKLLLVTIPACAMLWSRRGAIGRIAFLLTTAALLVTADIPLAFSLALANQFHVNAGGLIGKILTLTLTRPASPILLVLTLFYLWVYWRHSPSPQVTTNS
jgi:hypothetical protein